MIWTISFDEHALKELKKLSKDIQYKIRNYLRDKVSPLSDPKLIGKKLQYELSGLWRYRVDKYRIVCFIEEKTKTIIVLRIAKRDKVYRRL